MFLLFRVQDSHLEASGSLSTQLFHFAALPPPSTQWALASIPRASRTPAACRTLHQNSLHFVLGVGNSTDMIGGIWHTSHAAQPLEHMESLGCLVLKLHGVCMKQPEGSICSCWHACCKDSKLSRSPFGAAEN
jgi:hypothetical protein